MAGCEKMMYHELHQELQALLQGHKDYSGSLSGRNLLASHTTHLDLLWINMGTAEILITETTSLLP